MMKKKAGVFLLAVLLLFTACGEKEKEVELTTETEIEEVQGAVDLPAGSSEDQVDIESYLETREDGILTETDESEMLPFVFSADASWIWDRSNDNDTWMCLRKTVSLSEEESAAVTAHISVDSKYWLYINGEPVVLEGGVKRGMSQQLL